MHEWGQHDNSFQSGGSPVLVYFKLASSCSVPQGLLPSVGKTGYFSNTGNHTLFSQHPLDAKQLLIVSLTEMMLQDRKAHYESINCALDGLDSDSEDDVECEEDVNVTPSHVHNDIVAEHLQGHLDWHKYLLVVGRAGTGKSYALNTVIERCILKHLNVLVATPTGYLATEYKDRFPGDIESIEL